MKKTEPKEKKVNINIDELFNDVKQKSEKKTDTKELNVDELLKDIEPDYNANEAPVKSKKKKKDKKKHIIVETRKSISKILEKYGEIFGDDADILKNASEILKDKFIKCRKRDSMNRKSKYAKLSQSELMEKLEKMNKEIRAIKAFVEK